MVGFMKSGEDMSRRQRGDEDAPSLARKLPGILFGAVVIVLALGNSWVGLYPYGQAVWIRPLLSLVGILGAVGLFCGNGWWRVLLPAWSLCQSLVIATDVSGEWFYQGIRLGAGFTRSASTKINEMVTSYSARGTNTTGLVLLAIVAIIAIFRLHPPVRRKLSIRRPGFIVAALVLGGILAFTPIRHSGESSATFVLDLDVPNVPIYYKDQLLGRTPLQITPERIAEWKLPLDASQNLRLDGWGWADCAVLSDGKTVLPLFAGVPWPFGGYMDRFNSPWGERCRMHVGEGGGNRRTGFLYPEAALRHEPILTIEMRDAQPIAAGAPLRLRCVLKNPTKTDYVGRLATIQRLCFSYEKRSFAYVAPPASARREIKMPATWNTLPAGATLTEDLEFDAPVAGGDYELFCTWFLYKPGDNSGSGVGSNYSNVLLLRVK